MDFLLLLLKFAEGECADKNCAFMHTAPVCTFYLKQKCERKHCKFTHKKPSSQSDPPKMKTSEKNNKNPSVAPNVSNDAKNSEQAFLDLLTAHTKRLEQRLDQMQEKMEKNNNVWPQNTAFSQMWPTGQMHQLPQPSSIPLQAFQQRTV